MTNKTLNPKAKNLFFSLMASQFESIAKQAMQKKFEKERKVNKEAKLFDCGNFEELSFIITKEKTIQKIKYTNYKGMEELSPEERDRFASMVGIDIKKEQAQISEKGNPIKDIIFIANNDKKVINIFYTFTDNTVKTISL